MHLEAQSGVSTHTCTREAGNRKGHIRDGVLVPRSPSATYSEKAPDRKQDSDWNDRTMFIVPYALADESWPGEPLLAAAEDWPTPSASVCVTDFVLWANSSTTVSPQPWVPLSCLTAVVKPERDRILEQGSHSLHLLGQVSLLVLSG